MLVGKHADNLDFGGRLDLHMAADDLSGYASACHQMSSVSRGQGGRELISGIAIAGNQNQLVIDKQIGTTPIEQLDSGVLSDSLHAGKQQVA